MPLPAGTGQGRPFPKTLFNILVDLENGGGPFSRKMEELSLFIAHSILYIEDPVTSTKKLLEPMSYQVFNIPTSHLLVDSGSRPSEIGQYTVYSV